MAVVVSPFVVTHHVTSWQRHTHPVFGQPLCSVVVGNAQKPERDMTTRVFDGSVTVFLQVFLGAHDLRANNRWPDGAVARLVHVWDTEMVGQLLYSCHGTS